MKIAMLGIRGIPNCYSGFEVCAEEIASRLSQKGHYVTIYCRRRYFNPAYKAHKNIRLIVIPTIKNKYLDTFVHTLLSTFHLLLTDAKIIQYFGVGNSIFTFLPRVFGKKTFINVNGMDWTRKKWPYPAKLYLRFSAFLATVLPTNLITDSRKITGYYKAYFGKEPVLISYGSPVYTTPSPEESKKTLDRFGLEKNKYILFVGRLVPENNIDSLIRAYNRIKTGMKLVIAGDASYENEYISSLKHGTGPNIIFTGFLPEEAYADISRNAYIFVEPTEASGTHPAILGAMGFGSCVLVNNTPTNLETIGDAGLFYKGSEGATDLREKLEFLIGNPEITASYKLKALARARKYYSWDNVADLYEKLYCA